MAKEAGNGGGKGKKKNLGKEVARRRWQQWRKTATEGEEMYRPEDIYRREVLVQPPLPGKRTTAPPVREREEGRGRGPGHPAPIDQALQTMKQMVSGIQRWRKAWNDMQRFATEPPPPRARGIAMAALPREPREPLPLGPPGPGFTSGGGQTWPSPPEPERGYAWRQFIERQRALRLPVERIYAGMLEGSRGWGIPPTVSPTPRETPIAVQPGAIPIPERFHPPSVGTPGPGPSQADIQTAQASIFGLTYDSLKEMAEGQIARTPEEIMNAWREDAEKKKKYGYLREGIDNFIHHEALEVALKQMGIPAEYIHWIANRVYPSGPSMQQQIEMMTQPTPVPVPRPTPEAGKVFKRWRGYRR